MSDFEFSNKFYEEMAEKISQHKDYGKKNPVDIGIACGYVEEDVLGMIEMIRAIKEKNEQNSKKKRNIHYFLVNKEYGDYIVSVNTNTWKVKKVKKVEKDNRYIYKPYEFDIKGPLFARITGSGAKTLILENLETGDCKKFLSDEDIRKIILLDNEVFIATDSNLIIWNGEEIVAQKEYSGFYIWHDDLLIQVGDRIYIKPYSSDCIRAIDIELEGDFKKYKIDYPVEEHFYKSPEIYEVGNDDGKIFGFGCYEAFMGLLSFKTYGECFPMELKPKEGKIFNFKRNYFSPESKCVRDYMSKNYGLLGREIYSRKKMESKKWESSLCYFKRDILNEQVVVDYENDIFIGINTDNDIIKIDLKNEREAIVIPVNFVNEEKL